MDTKYSLTTLLNDLLKLQNNGYQIITKLSEVVSSNAETVEIPIADTNGAITTVVVPSFGSVKNQLVRLENNLKNLSGIGDSDSSLQLADGSFRKILVSNLQQEAADITSMAVPKEFATKENWFFESFLNPLLYVKFDLTNQIKFNTEKVEVSRYILNIDSEAKRKVFNERFLSKDNIQYQNFIKVLLDNNISYFLDKDVTDVPPRSLRYWGSFAVTKIVDDTVSDTVNSVSFQKRVLRVQLDKLQYNDSQSEFLGTQSLKIGDSLVVNSGRKNTRYEITGIESASRTLSIKLIEGFDPIQLGTDIFTFYSEDETSISVDVNIGFNEYSVIFIKGIDPDSKIAAVNWSPGVGIYTNDLTIIDDTTDQEISLATYYQNKVVDFGSYLYSIAKDGVIPSTLGIDPDAPLLNSENFKTLQINQHVTETSALTDLKKLQSDKLRIQSDMNALDSSIASLRSKIQTTRYTTKQLEDADRNELARIVDEKTAQSQLYASTVDDINKIGNTNSVEDLTPKYRVRGFFPMPEAKTSPRTAPQEVVQFIIQYRYLSKDGGSNQPDQINFIDNDGQQRRGTFATWVEVKTDVRKRITDPTTGNTTWMVEDVENADTVNINSVDIPISFNEAIEFRIKSLSESGWPISPKESSWSDIIRVDFPAEFEANPDVSGILQEAKNDKVRIDLQAELQTLGVPKHVANQFEQNGKFFAHAALEIASGFLTSEQNVISLFDKLSSLDSQLAEVRSLLESTRGVLVIRVIDESGQEFAVTPNTTLKLFAGNYRDQVASLTIKKGVIITKNYFIKISNDSASTLELYARFWGSKTSISQLSYSQGETYDLNDLDYNRVRRYDYVPLGLSNPSTIELGYGFVRNYPESTSQVLGQFIQSRYFNIDGTKPLYGQVLGATHGIYSSRPQIDPITYPVPTLSTGYSDLEYILDPTYQNAITNAIAIGTTAAGDFIWKGATATTTTKDVIPSTDPTITAAYANSILLHIDHPEIDNYISQSDPNLAASYSTRNSIFGNQPVGSTGSQIQTPFAYWGSTASIGTSNKIGFDPDDQYLIGPRSTGSYLYVSPNNYGDIVVDGSDSLSVRRVKFGESESISIPVTFQYRMTDYYGDGSSGFGNLAGNLNSLRGSNLTYTKTIGIDIYSNPLMKERFSFDIELTARYYSRTIVTNDIPTRTFEAALDDLNGTIKTITPRTSRNVGVAKNSAGGNANRT
jgi:hypothetical protein